MADPVLGVLDIQTDPGGVTRVVLNPDSADITAGGNGGSGDLILKNANGVEVAKLGRVQETVANPNQPQPTVIADYTGLRVRTANGATLVQIGRIDAQSTPLDPNDEIEIVLGGSGFSGTVRLVDKNGKTRFVLGRDQGQDGRLVVFAPTGQKLLEFHSHSAALYLGAQGNEGDLILRDGSGQESVKLDGGGRSLRLGTASAPRIRLESGNAWLGGHGDDGDVVLFASGGDNTTLGNSTIHLNGSNANLRLGGNNTDGDIILQAPDGSNRIRLDAGQANLWLGGNGRDGDLMVFSRTGDNQTSGNASIHLNGDAGDIILRNADCAEEFDVAPGDAEAGSVMVLDDDGRLTASRTAYDRRVAGVVSGAGDYRPGIVLDRQHSAGPRVPVALTGKAYCKVDAQYGPIEPGDLLTTSPTPGHAMKASDPSQAFGAVIGKALRRHAAGTGLIPLLIALQ